MPGTFSNLLYHIVFSTSGREPSITPDIQPRLYRFIGGIVRAEHGVLYTIGGMPDHVHLLVRWRTDESAAYLLRNVKARSSRWVHQTFPGSRSFAWQEGYSIFSVSQSQKPKVERYIATQEQHHRRRDFKKELIALLDAHEVVYDARYVFD